MPRLGLLVALFAPASTLALLGAPLRPALAPASLASRPAPRTRATPPAASLLSKAKKGLGLLTGANLVEGQAVPCGGELETVGAVPDECLAICDEEGCEVMGKSEVFRKAKIGIYILLWFALSTGYNIQNKVRLNMLRLPWCQSAASLLVGSLFVTPLWLTGIRKAPKLSKDAILTLLPIAFCHSIGHIAAVVSAGAGAVSFTQIVKAAEPVFTCGLSALILGQAVAPLTVLALLPIVGGVALASATELSFTWLAFGGAMVSNLAFATRNICSRVSMDKPKGENMTPENLFGVLTVMSFCFALPLALIIEGPTAAAAWTAAAVRTPPAEMVKASVITGLYFYTYNEVAMLALNNVDAVTHAVANTIKRVVILLACVVAFRTPMTPLCTAGSAIAIAGGYLYSLAKGAEKEKKA